MHDQFASRDRKKIANERGRRGATSASQRFAAARGKRFHREEGSVIVELALSLPMLMLLFTGVLTFAAAYNHQLILTQAVGAGGQYLQQLRSSTTDPCQDTMTVIKNSAPSLDPSSITLTLTMNGAKVTGSSCGGYQSYLLEGTPVTVSATYPCSLQVFSMKFASSCQLTAQVTEYEY